MAPKLRVLISTDQAYPPTTICHVNGPAVPISTPGFKGTLAVYVKDFEGEGKAGDGHEYFGIREDMTYGIVVKGHFLDSPNADEVVFGNVFELPIRDSLPWGTAIATKFMYFIDPTLELDVYCDKPWALSPVVSTMTKLRLKRLGDKKEEKKKDDKAEDGKDSSAVVSEDALGVIPELAHLATDTAARRKYLADPAHRSSLVLSPDVEVGMEFSNGILDFNTLSVQLPKPFNVSFNLLKYWDGQPVTYVCRRKSANPVSAEGVHWSVAFEIVDEEAKKELEKKGKTVVESSDLKDKSVQGEEEDAQKAKDEKVAQDVEGAK